ncbi:hypothetical protein D3C87_190400 [compost metagenome]
MKHFFILAVLSSLILSCSTLQRKPATSQPFPAPMAGSLFASYEPLNFELDAPLADLFAQKGKDHFTAKAATVSGVLSYTDEQNKKVRFPVEVKMKGFSSIQMCSFPKIELKIKSNDRRGTYFENIKTVDLNTHCAENEPESDPYREYTKDMFYAHREVLIYRMAEVLEIPTLRARPIFIKYRNTKIAKVNQNPEPYRAFFLEDMSDLRKRLQAREIKGVNDSFKKNPKEGSEDIYIFKDLQSSPQTDVEDAARIALFQAMIGNLDWFIKTKPEHVRFESSDKVNLWNTKILEMTDGRWVLFPQDFNFSGILRGFLYGEMDKVVFNVVDEATQERIKKSFVDKKTEIYSLLETLTKDKQGTELMKSTLDQFYIRIESL